MYGCSFVRRGIHKRLTSQFLGKHSWQANTASQHGKPTRQANTAIQHGNPTRQSNTAIQHGNPKGTLGESSMICLLSFSKSNSCNFHSFCNCFITAALKNVIFGKRQRVNVRHDDDKDQQSFYPNRRCPFNPVVLKIKRFGISPFDCFSKTVGPKTVNCYTAGARRTAHGALRTAHGARRTAHGALRTENGARRTAHGARCIVHGARHTAYGAQRTSTIDDKRTNIITVCARFTMFLTFTLRSDFQNCIASPDST